MDDIIQDYNAVSVLGLIRQQPGSLGKKLSTLTFKVNFYLHVSIVFCFIFFYS